MDLTNPTSASATGRGARGTLHLFRSIFLWKVCYQRLRLRELRSSRAETAYSLRIQCGLRGHFRGPGHSPRAARHPSSTARFQRERRPRLPRGLIGSVRPPDLDFPAGPPNSPPTDAQFGCADSHEEVVPDHHRLRNRCEEHHRLLGYDVAIARPPRTCRLKERRSEIYTANGVQRLGEPSHADIDMMVTETPHGLYRTPAPWFSTPFGRDGFTALQTLWLNPNPQWACSATWRPPGLADSPGAGRGTGQDPPRNPPR